MKKLLLVPLLLFGLSCNKTIADKDVIADTTALAYYNLPVEGMDSVIAAIRYDDSIKYEAMIDSIIDYYEDASKVKDKIYENKINDVEIKNDSLRVELFKAQYKLNKISQYNAIAAKGNNIKYLRGWIRRALEE